MPDLTDPVTEAAVDRSALGTEGARLLRHRTSPDRAAEIVRRVGARPLTPADLLLRAVRDQAWTSVGERWPLLPADLGPVVAAAAGGDPAAVDRVLRMVRPLVRR